MKRWVVFTMDEVWGAFPSKGAALRALHNACLDDRAAPPCRRQADGTYEYEPPSRRHTYWLTNRQDVLIAAGVDLDSVTNASVDGG